MLNKLWRFTRAAVQVYVMDWLLGWAVTAVTVSIYTYYKPLVWLWWGIVFCGVYAFQVYLISVYLKGIEKEKYSRTSFEKFAIETSQSMHLAARAGIYVLSWVKVFIGRITGRIVNSSNEATIPDGGVLPSLFYGWVLGGFLLQSYRYSKHQKEYVNFWRDMKVAAVTFSIRFSVMWVLAPIGILSVW